MNKIHEIEIICPDLDHQRAVALPFRLRDMPIIAKIAIPATIIAVVALGIVLYASAALSGLSDSAAGPTDRNAARVELPPEADSNFSSTAVSEKNVILTAAGLHPVDASDGGSIPPIPGHSRFFPGAPLQGRLL